jgi:nucleotide-binding universal stress UspA family protein
MKLLICTDGSKTSIQSAELVSKFGFPADTHITVLGVSENIEHIDNLTLAMEQINTLLGPLYNIERKIRNGNPIEEIMAEAIVSLYDLVAVGGGGQLGLLHPQVGQTTRNLARKLNTHFLVAQNTPPTISKILFCVGPESQSSIMVELGGKWISSTSAQVGVLHVLAKESAGLAQGEKLLAHAVEQLHNAGVKSTITTKIRRGLVVGEVINEINEGDYDILVVGAHYQPGRDRWQGTLLDDVTDQLLHRSTCSMIII